MSFFIRRGSQLRFTGFSTLPPTVVFKSGKHHALTGRQSADRLKPRIVFVSPSENILSKSNIFEAIYNVFSRKLLTL